MKAIFGILAACGLMSLAAHPAAAQSRGDKMLDFVASTDWDCDDRVAFDGADGGLHDTVSILRVKFDADWRFTGLFNSSLPYGGGLYNRSYNISGYAFEEDGKTGIFIEKFSLTARDELPEGIGWRTMARMIYYIQMDGDAMSLQGVWEDTSGGRERSVCG